MASVFTPNRRPWRSRHVGWRRWLLIPLAAIALVATVATGGWLVRERWQADAADTAFRQLLAAAGARRTRPVDGRLTAFAHAPAPAPMRGAGEPDIPPDIRIAVARLDQLSREAPTPRNSAAAGVGFLAQGDLDKAVELLEDAAQAEPGNVSFQTDLSAAYLARAAAREQAEDWAKALASAARALVAEPSNAAAHFNRALALDGLRLPLAALTAWTEYPRIESAGPWVTEAIDRANRLRDRSRRAGTANDDAEVNTQPLREEVEERLLPAWGNAVLKGDPGAGALLAEAERKAGELQARQGDTMAHDQVALIRRLDRAGDRRRLRLLADGHVQYGRAREEFGRSNFERSANLMTAAAQPFAVAGSPYAMWAPIYRAIHLRYRREPAQALDQLRTVPIASVPATYRNLRGRLAWTEGVMWGASGRPDLERAPIARAIGEFQAARERDHQIMTTTLLAETDWFLGDQRRAWSSLRDALALVADRDWTNRNYHFIIGSLIAGGVGLPEVALEFLHARVRLQETPQSRGEALLQRARLHTSLGDTRAAAADLDLAVQAFASLEDPALREATVRDVEIARAELVSGTDCAAAIAHADRAYPMVAASLHSIRIVGLLAVRAKCRASLRDLEGAKRDLAEAAGAFECRRSQLGTDIDRVRAFEQERTAFEALMTIEAVDLHDEAAALRTAERSRAGVLSETWRPAIRPPAAPCGTAGSVASVPAADPPNLPAGVAIVYYEALGDRVLTWVLTRERRTMLTAAVSAAALRRTVTRMQRAIRQGADLAALQPYSRELFDPLVAPALDAADRFVALEGHPGPATVFFVPDGPLFAVPFGALPDARGQPLIRTRAVGVTPSLATFEAASARLATFEPADVLAIGDGHDPQESGLPRLAGADREAAAVRQLYPRGLLLAGASATKARVLHERRAVVHFAGHTVVNEHNPRYSQMLLAPDPAIGDAGRLLGAEITPALLAGTGVVVLATCDGAAGRLVEGEGAISVARTFFAAGVPAVVASLWPVADDLQDFAQTLHRELRTDRDATGALRKAQLAVLDARGPRAPVSVWGGFILFGGQRPVH